MSWYISDTNTIGIDIHDMIRYPVFIEQIHSLLSVTATSQLQVFN